MVLGLSLLSCGREVTGPGGGLREAAFALDPRMPAAFAVAGSGDVVPFDRVRVTLHRLSGELVKEEIVPFDAATESVELSLEVTLPFGTTVEGIDLTLNMQYINAQGDTVFRAGPQTVTAVPVSANLPTPVVPVDVVYVGTGANAISVHLSPSGGSVVSGTTTTFTAVAAGPNEAPIPNTPVIFSSPDVTRVTVTPAGVATWLPVRGTARMIATLPTNMDADTVSFTVTLPATKLAIIGGNGQSGLPGEPLESAIQLLVTAADDVPVAGVTVTFAVVTGGGSVTTLTAISDANGLVSTSWTLGDTPGAQSITATFTGLVGGALTLNANGTVPPPTGIATWTGAVSQDFSLAGNWAGGVAPTTTDSVIIPAGAQRNPILTATQTIVQAVDIQAGTLWMDGHQLMTLGDFVTTNSGVLVMQDENDILIITGDAVFAGGDESGLITEGAISVGGNFTQVSTNSPASFQAGVNHEVVLQGANPTLTFGNPGGAAAESRFGNLAWVGGGTMTQNSGVSVTGLFATLASTASTHLGIGGAAGRYLEFSQYFNAGPAVFDNIRLAVYQPLEPEPVTINNATLRNLPSTATQILVVSPGGFDITIDNVVFQTTPTTGVYITANDLMPSDGEQLVVNVANPSPAAPGGFTSVFGGAVINWPAGVERTWIGTTSTAWTTASNWFPAVVPGPMDDVSIPAGTTFAPTSVTAASIGGLMVHAGATLTVASGTFAVSGDIVSDGLVLVDEFEAAFNPAGTGRSIRGNFENINVLGAYALSGPLSVTNDILIRGSLNPAGSSITTTDLVMLSAGVLIMQDAEDLVTVNGQALFTGGGTFGLLTNGVLRVGGRLVSNTSGSGSPPNSFAPSFSHTLQLFGSGTFDIDILNLGGVGNNTSYIRHLDISQHTGTINFVRANNNYVSGQLISQPSGAPPTLASTGGATLRLDGVSVNGLIVDNVPVIIGEGALDQFDNVRFTGFAPLSGPLGISNAGNSGPFTMNGLIFETVPSGTGARYLLANDADGPTGPNPLVINVNGASPASPGAFATAANGALINWPGSAGLARLWTGGANTSWTDALNWSDGIVPTATDSVRITAAAPNDPVLVDPVTLRAITVETGATLGLGEFSLTVSGHVNVPATLAVTADGEGQFRMTGPVIANVSGALPGVQVLGGTYTVSGPMSVNGDLLVGGGFLNITVSALTVTGDLATSDVGVLSMSGPADVSVAGNATFGGGGTSDYLTGGTLFVGGNFSQGGVDVRSFAAGPGHTVVLNGTAPQTVTFASPDLATNTACAASCFGTLRTTRQPTDGAVQFLSGAKAVTQLALSAEVIDATGFTLLSGGTPDITALNFTAAKLGFVTGINRNVELWAVDSLIGMGNGLTLPAFLSTPTRLAGSYSIAGPHGAGLVVTQGALDVVGRSEISGDLVTRANGWVRMQQAADTLIVNGNASFGGNAPITQLTAGVLTVNGSFAQTTDGVASFNAETAHKTRIIGPGATVSVTDQTFTRFGTLEFSTSGAQVLTSATVSGDVIVSSVSGPITGVDIFPLQVIQVNGGLYDTLGGMWQARNTRFNNANPALPATMASNAYFAQATTLLHDMTFTSELNIVSNGVFDLNGNRVSVLGAFRTNEDGIVRMMNPADTLSLSALASFAGGATTGQMTAGTLELYGNTFQQALNATAFAPSGTHTTYMFGATSQDVTFANPGTGAGASHFNHLVLAQGIEGATVNLLSDAWADGQLITQASPSRRISASTSRLFHSRGASIGGSANMEFSNVRWALTDAEPATIDGLRFLAMDPAAIQFSILRAGPTLSLANLEFMTTPTTGAYMRVEDSDGAANGNLVVTVSGVTPSNHGGFLTVVPGATVNGWPMAPEFRWTGATSSDWATPSNWSGGSVPGAADSAFIAAGMPNSPVVNGLDSVRTLALEAGANLLLRSNLWVHGSVDVPPTASITAEGAELRLSSETGGTIRGDLPYMEIQGGLFTLIGNTNVGGNLYIYGQQFGGGAVWTEGDLSVGNFTLTTTGGLFTGQEGTFTMMGTGLVDLGEWANFFGNSTAGKLTNGTLRVRGNFDQDSTDASPQSFAPSGAHVTELVGTLSQRIRLDGGDDVVGATCLASCFANLRVIKAPGQGGVNILAPLKVTGTLTIQADSVNAEDHPIIATGTPVFDTPILRAGALAWQTGFTQNATTVAIDSLIAWGTGAELVGRAGTRTIVRGSYFLDQAFPSSIQVDAGGSLVLDQTFTITGDLTVAGFAGATAGSPAADITITGNLLVRGAGTFQSMGAAHVITVNGSATFDGGPSTGDLATGRLRIGADLTQLATSTPFSLRPAPTHVTEFFANGNISFATPASSALGTMAFATTGLTRTLLTDMTVQGTVAFEDDVTLRTALTGANNSRRLTASDVTVYATPVSLSNVALTARTFDADGELTLINFDPEVVQIEIASADNAGSGMASVTFTTQPTGAGRYLRVIDLTPAGTDGSPSMSVSNAISPVYHGGWAEAVAPATMTGWDPAPNLRWEGGVSSDWNTPGNWVAGVVPTFADSVYIGASFTNPPQLPAGGVIVRAFVSDYEGPFNLGQPLRVSEQFHSLPTADITCDGGSLELAGATNPVRIDGALASNCTMRALSGTTALDGRMVVGGDVQVEGEALLVLARNTLVVGGNFSTMGGGRLRMTEGTDSLVVANGATFSGGSTDGLLTAGVLALSGNFSQGGGAFDAFSASGAHTTIFAGLGSNQTSTFANPGDGPGTSHFANVEMSMGEPGNWLQLNSIAFATGQLRTGAGAPAQQIRKVFDDLDPASALFQSRGGDVANITFWNVKWSILDGAPIDRMDQITFTATDSAATHLNIERAGGATIGIRQIVFGPDPLDGGGVYIRIVDLDDTTGGTVTVNVDGVTPGFRNDQFIVLLNGALLTGWPIG